MKIGVVKERKDGENRVGMTPDGVKTLLDAGHRVIVERNAGTGSGFEDREYAEAGAVLADDARDVYAESELLIKVKEPLPEEYPFLRQGQILFAYLHPAAMPRLRQALQASQCIAFAYEMVRDRDGSLPLLVPMSEIAGRMSIQIAARLLEKSAGGPGIMLGGVPGVAPAEVVIVGGGIVGENAARMAVGAGARVTVLEVNPARLRQLERIFNGRARTLMSSRQNILAGLKQADVLIGAVLVPGKQAPKVVTKEMIAAMKPGSVVIDVAVDQGGCIETIDRTTSHTEPTYVVDGVVHYAVPNIPGMVPRTATLALTNATLPYILELAGKGWEQVIAEKSALAEAVCYVRGSQVANF